MSKSFPYQSSSNGREMLSGGNCDVQHKTNAANLPPAELGAQHQTFPRPDAA